MIKVRERSLLRFSRMRYLDGILFWDPVLYADIPAQTDDLTHTITPIDRPDTIASRYYGDPSFWKIIAAANGFELMPNDFKIGLTIRIPSPRYVLDVLFAKHKRF